MASKMTFAKKKKEKNCARLQQTAVDYVVYY